MTDQQPANIQQILEARARSLARPPAHETANDSVGLVVLAIGAERYGVDIGYVQEVRPVAGMARVPGAPPIWAGVVNLRGRLYAILDLRRYLGLPESGASAAAKVVVVAAAGLVVGLLADDVLDVYQASQADLAPPLVEIAGAKRAIVAGITADLLIVLDLEELLSDPRLTVQADVN